MFAWLLLLAAAPPVEPPTFLAVGAGPSAAPVRGKLGRLQADAAEIRTPDGTTKVPSVVALRQADRLVPPWPTGPMLLTSNGDRIPGRLTGGDAQSLHFRPSFATDNSSPDWKVPYAAAAAVWLTTPPAETPSDPKKYAWLGDERRDVLLFRNGDVIRGTLESVGTQVRFKAASETAARDVPLASLAAIAFNPALARVRKPREAFVHAVLTNGTRLDLTGAASEGAALLGKATFGSAVQIPLSDVVSLDVRQGKAVFLSDLVPKAVEHTDFLGQAPSFSRDRDRAGEPLRLTVPEGRATFDKGLGVRARTKLTYTLNGRVRRFDTWLGLDGEAAKHGACVARILVDGKDRLAANDGRITLGAARFVSLDVTGAKELTLLVEFGPSGGVQCEVNWGEARLVE